MTLELALLNVKTNPRSVRNLSEFLLCRVDVQLFGTTAHAGVCLVQCELGHVGSYRNVEKGMVHHFQPMPVHLGVATDLVKLYR